MAKYLTVIPLLFVLWSCNELRKDIPYSSTDTYDSIREKGSKAYTQQHKKWMESWSTEKSAEGGDPNCAHEDFQGSKLAKDFMAGEKKLREQDGGEGCRCIPMGDSCATGTCNCDEICPNHHGILRGRAGQMSGTKENELAFTNRTDLNDSTFKKYHNTDGFCSGMNTVQRKFQMLSDMRPDLRSWPAMKKGSPEWRKYILTQIDRFGSKESPEFVGVSDMTELGADEEFAEALRKKSDFNIPKGMEKDKDYWETQKTLRSWPKPKFSHSNAADIPAKVAIDPDTKEAIPSEGTQAYHDYIEKKVKTIASGHPASLPGYTSIHSLSSDPTYQEIMGAQAAIDWKTFNTFEDDEGFMGYSSGSDNGSNKPNEPMTKDQLNTFIVQAKGSLPRFPDTYPNGKKPGDVWNEGGPYQTLPISLRATEKTGKTEDHAYHSIEAWAYEPLPPKGVKVCIKDPNREAGIDDNCANAILIPDPNDPSKVTYDGFPTRKVGKFNFSAYGTGHIGSMTDKLIAYCRRVKAPFRGGGACSK